jgi:hypothetical protein
VCRPLHKGFSSLLQLISPALTEFSQRRASSETPCNLWQVGDSLSLWLDGLELTGMLSDALSSSAVVSYTPSPGRRRVLRLECAVQTDKLLLLSLPELRWLWADNTTTWDRLHLVRMDNVHNWEWCVGVQ